MKKYIVFLLILPFIFISCQGGEDKKMDNKKEKSLSGKKVLMIIAHQDFRDEEFKEPYSLFTDEGASVVIASTDTGEAQGMLGMKVKPDILVMHPGPINRGLEIESEVADGKNSVILQQVKNGLAVRMAVLFLVNQAAAQKK